MTRDTEPGTQRDTGDQHALDRRALLRRGGAVLAGAAGLTAIGSASSSAAAAVNDPLLQGVDAQDAGTTTTGLTAATADNIAALKVSNRGGGAPLRVGRTAQWPAPASQSGDLRNSAGSLLYTHHGTEDDAVPEAVYGEVYTDAWANLTQPLSPPQRLIDTRSDRSRVLNPDGKFDASYRLLKYATITLDVSDLVTNGVAVYMNITITDCIDTGSRYLIVWPEGARPSVSSINFTTGQTLSNFALCGLSHATTPSSFEIYTYGTTHVIIDATAFTVNYPGQVTAGTLSAMSSTTTKFTQNHKH